MSTSAKTYNIYGITAILAVSGAIMGLEASSLAAFLTAPQFYEYFGPLTNWDEKLIASSSAIGAAIGSIVSGGLCDAFGCIKTFQAAGIIWLVGTTIVIFSPYIHLIVLGRVVKGFAMGEISSMVPVYISETIPSNRKGSSISVVHLCSTLATLVLYYIGYILQNMLKDDSSFKYTWALESIPAFMLLGLSLFLPESPKWLASKSRWEDAAKNLGRIERYQSQKLGFSKSKEKNRERVGDKSYVIQAYTAGPVIRNCSFEDLFGKRYWKYTAIGILTQMFAQLTCVKVMNCFFFHVCSLCGLEGDHKILVVSIQYVVSALFTFFPVFFLDNCRRKDSLTFGMFTLSLAYFALCALNVLYGEAVSSTMMNNGSPFDWQLRREPASAMLALCFFLISVYSSLIISVSWLYTGEIFPGPARSKGSSVCMFVSWITNGSLTLVFPYMAKSIGPYSFCVLGMICFIGACVFSRLPESRQLTELQIESLYDEPPTLEQEKGAFSEIMDDRISQQSDNSAKSGKSSLFRDKQIYEEIKSAAHDGSPAYSGDTVNDNSPDPYELSNYQGSIASPEATGMYEKSSPGTDINHYDYDYEEHERVPRRRARGDDRRGRRDSNLGLPVLEPQTTATEVLEAYTALDSFSPQDKISLEKDDEEDRYSSDWLEDSGNYSPLRDFNAASHYRDYDPSHEFTFSPEEDKKNRMMSFNNDPPIGLEPEFGLEPTNIFQFDNSKYARRPNLQDQSKTEAIPNSDSDWKHNRGNLNGGRFVNTKDYTPKKKGRR